MKNYIRNMLITIGEDYSREGLKDTPDRIIRSWKELYSGYGKDIKALKTDFTSEKYDQMIVAKNIELYSMCEHHNLPFIGRVHVAYIPGKKLLGLSKLARVVEVFARRMQIQERLTDQIADGIEYLCKPKGVGVVIEAKHLCVMSRGVQKQNMEMYTSSLRGVFRQKDTKDEFMRIALCKS